MTDRKTETPKAAPPGASGGKRTTRILLVDDHPMMRDGLRTVIDQQPWLEVVGEADDGWSALALAAELEPDVVVMDVALPRLGGIEATRRLTAERPDVKVIALSLHNDRRYVLAMLRAGAVAYLVKTSVSDQLIQAIRAVVAGQAFLSPEVAAVAIELADERSPEPRGVPANASLSPRQVEVLRLIAAGRSSKEIARELGLATRTVETHRREIIRKLDLHSVAELVKYAIREGLTSLE